MMTAAAAPDSMRRVVPSEASTNPVPRAAQLYHEHKFVVQMFSRNMAFVSAWLVAEIFPGLNLTRR